MGLQTYGLLKGKVINKQEDRANYQPHYNVHVQAGMGQYRISINIKSNNHPSELLFYANEDFRHPMTTKLKEYGFGFFQKPDVFIDYIRGNMRFKREDMSKVLSDLQGPNNDVNDILDTYIEAAILSHETELYVFGAKWTNRNISQPDQIFGFFPSMGIHDIHMNQGNYGSFQGDNGVGQDGCILLHIPSKDQWIGLFLAFQSQSWETDDRTGDMKVVKL
ncbi:MAG: YukJ family protein [Vallitaleaceae bacterium]|nr:YukJ family protein [Vallitaleaceae bacterium]